MWGRYTFTVEFCCTRVRAYPDNILVQSKVVSVCPRIILEAGMVQRGRLLWIDCDLLSFVPGNGPLEDVASYPLLISND